MNKDYLNFIKRLSLLIKKEPNLIQQDENGEYLAVKAIVRKNIRNLFL